MSQMHQKQNTFEEISRMKISPNNDVVLSKMGRTNGEVCLHVNHQADPSSPAQYKARGVSIPLALVEEFIQMVTNHRGMLPDDKKESMICE
jgi:hypothetical protein